MAAEVASHGDRHMAAHKVESKDESREWIDPRLRSLPREQIALAARVRTEPPGSQTQDCIHRDRRLADTCPDLSKKRVEPRALRDEDASRDLDVCDPKPALAVSRENTSTTKAT